MTWLQARRMAWSGQRVFKDTWKISPANTVADLLFAEDVWLDVEVVNKASLLDAIGRHMDVVHALPQEDVSFGLTRREKLASTGLGLGVAIPHTRVRDLNQARVAYLRLKSPIPFDAPDDEPVTDVLVLLVPKQATEDHLKLLADASRMFADSRFREGLHRCISEREVERLFKDWS